MAFGDNYMTYDAPEGLEDGEYRARIKSATISVNKFGKDFVTVSVEISGHPGCYPSQFFLNEAPKVGEMKANGTAVEQRDVDIANGRLTRFFKSFGIQDGDFDIRNWKGHIGTVKCAPQYDKNESDHKSKSYKDLTPVFHKAKEEKPAPKAAAPKTEAPKVQNGPDGKPFPEDDPGEIF